MPYSINKRDGLWWVVDTEGFEISYVGHPLKKDAIEAMRVAEYDCRMAAKQAEMLIRLTKNSQ